MKNPMAYKETASERKFLMKDWAGEGAGESRAPKMVAKAVNQYSFRSIEAWI